MAAKKPSVSFDHPVKFEARVPEFEPLASVQSLDFDKLATGNHKVEVGFMKGPCCKNLVRAVVKKGMVTGIEIEECANPAPKAQSAELAKIAAAARTRLYGQPGPPKWKPFAVRDLANPQTMGLIIVGGWCILICTRWFCFYCCLWPPRCGPVVISTDPL